VATFNVRVDVPEPVIDDGLKVAVTSDGRPVAENATGELNPFDPVTVTTTEPFCPQVNDSEPVETETAKLGSGATVSVTVDVCVTPPPMPVTVIG
jgi:hypothetical protein